MQRRRTSRASVFPAILATTLASNLLVGIGAATELSITQIDFPGAVSTSAFGINDRGAIVGAYTDIDGNWHGFVRETNGSFSTLGPWGLAGDLLIFGINNTLTTGKAGGPTGTLCPCDEIVGINAPNGVGDTSTYQPVAMLCSPGNSLFASCGPPTVIDLSVTGGASAEAINNNSVIAGFFGDASGQHGYLLDALFQFSLPPHTTVDFPGAEFTRVSTVANDGTAGGEYQNSSGGLPGFLFDGVDFTTVTVPGASVETDITGINDAGHMVATHTSNPLRTTFEGSYFDGSAWIEIVIPGAISVSASDLNSSDQIVGRFRDATGTHGFLAAPTRSVRFSGSLILHDFETAFRKYFTQIVSPPATSAFFARPLGASCIYFPAPGYCSATLVEEGAPLTGSGVANVTGRSPAMFTLPRSNLHVTASGQLPVRPTNGPSVVTTTASVDNDYGIFAAGRGPGNFSMIPQILPAVPGGNHVAFQAGANQFGGTMRLLGTIGATRTHLAPNLAKARFTGTGTSLFNVLGGTCFPHGSGCEVGAGSRTYGNFTYTRRLRTTTTMASIGAWGWGWTTGSVTVTASNGNGYPIALRRKGYDNRSPSGAYGTIQLVAPRVAHWNFANRIDPPWDRASATIGILRIQFIPEPSGWLLSGAGLVFLAVLYRARGRK